MRIKQKYREPHVPNKDADADEQASEQQKSTGDDDQQGAGKDVKQVDELQKDGHNKEQEGGGEAEDGDSDKPEQVGEDAGGGKQPGGDNEDDEGGGEDVAPHRTPAPSSSGAKKRPRTTRSRGGGARSTGSKRKRKGAQSPAASGKARDDSTEDVLLIRDRFFDSESQERFKALVYSHITKEDTQGREPVVRRVPVQLEYRQLQQEAPQEYTCELRFWSKSRDDGQRSDVMRGIVKPADMDQGQFAGLKRQGRDGRLALTLTRDHARVIVTEVINSGGGGSTSGGPASQVATDPSSDTRRGARARSTPRISAPPPEKGRSERKRSGARRRQQNGSGGLGGPSELEEEGQQDGALVLAGGAGAEDDGSPDARASVHCGVLDVMESLGNLDSVLQPGLQLQQRVRLMQDWASAGRPFQLWVRYQTRINCMRGPDRMGMFFRMVRVIVRELMPADCPMRQHMAAAGDITADEGQGSDDGGGKGDGGEDPRQEALPEAALSCLTTLLSCGDAVVYWLQVTELLLTNSLIDEQQAGECYKAITQATSSAAVRAVSLDRLCRHMQRQGAPAAMGDLLPMAWALVALQVWLVAPSG